MEQLMTAHRIIKNLTRQGNSMLGVGCYSAALASRNGEDAIKIGTDMYDPWLDYKQLVIAQHKDNPHVPRIKSFYIDTQSEYYVCVMERLYPVNAIGKASDLTAILEGYVSGWHSDEELLALIAPYKDQIPQPTQMLEVLQTIKAYTTHFRNGRRVGDSTITFFESDPDEDDTEGRKLDMHRGNFMLRDDVIVIIDPWCNVDMDDVADLSQWVGSNGIEVSTYG
jgi:hypothetical protein